MNDFEVWKEAFARVGVDIEKYKKSELHYNNEGVVEYEGQGFQTDKLSVGGYYGLQFTMILNEDKSIKKLELCSNF